MTQQQQRSRLFPSLFGAGFESAYHRANNQVLLDGSSFPMSSVEHEGFFAV